MSKVVFPVEYLRWVFNRRGKYCNKYDADNTDDKTCDNKYRQFFGFPHGNFLSELNLWGCLDRFFELQVLKLD